jgi:hypothetical protein
VTPRGGWERLARWGLGLGLALVLGGLAPGPVATNVARAAPAAKRATRAPTIYTKNRSFRIPFGVEPADRAIVDVELFVSEDSGFTWKMVSRTTPDHPSFTFRSGRDAEYWFAVRTRDKDGKFYPSEDEPVEPSMKVIVDTVPPSLALEPDGRRGSRVAVRWEVRDENLDKLSLVLEYQAEGASAWRQVPIANKGLIGSATWEAGTAEPLQVRGSIVDKAGNKTEQTIAISEGTPENPGMIGNDSTESTAPPPIARYSSSTSFPPPERLPQGLSEPDFDARPSPRNPPGASAPRGFDPGEYGGGGGMGGGSPPPGGRGAAAGGGQTLLVASPQFALQYAVEDAGPHGPAIVELWVTQNSGRTWSRRGEDPDRTSPFLVDLGGDGTFGLCLVARAASGLGDQPPAPGDPPQTWVEVDSTPPTVQLEPPQVGTGQNLGKVAIRWRASDLHLGAQPVTIAWRADQPGAAWYPIAERIENMGLYVWTVPPNIPARFHLRVDVLDSVGNRGTAETLEGSPVTVDRTRPRSRILGLDPSARSGHSAAPVAGSGSVVPR